MCLDCSWWESFVTLVAIPRDNLPTGNAASFTPRISRPTRAWLTAWQRGNKLKFCDIDMFSGYEYKGWKEHGLKYQELPALWPLDAKSCQRVLHHCKSRVFSSFPFPSSPSLIVLSTITPYSQHYFHMSSYMNNMDISHFQGYHFDDKLQGRQCRGEYLWFS